MAHPLNKNTMMVDKKSIKGFRFIEREPKEELDFRNIHEIHEIENADTEENKENMRMSFIQVGKQQKHKNIQKEDEIIEKMEKIENAQFEEINKRKMRFKS